MSRQQSMSFFLPILLVGILLLPARGAQAQSRQIDLVAADGHHIAATLTRARQKDNNPVGIVLLPMYRRTKDSWQPLVDRLVKMGMTTLAIDLRGHGRSRFAPDGSDDWQRVLDRDPELFAAMHLDAEAAIRYLDEHENIPAGKTALVGASVGCSVAIEAAVIMPVGAVVVMTPGKKYLGIPTMEDIRHWRGTPLLILTSNEEADRGAAAIHDKLRHKGAVLKTFDMENIHGTNMFGRVPGVEDLITHWIAEQLGK